jgi:hypothetical protein
MNKIYKAKINYKDTSNIINEISVKINFKAGEIEYTVNDVRIELKYFLEDILDDMEHNSIIVNEVI